MPFGRELGNSDRKHSINADILIRVYRMPPVVVDVKIHLGVEIGTEKGRKQLTSVEIYLEL